MTLALSSRPCCAWCGRRAKRDTDSRCDHVFADETQAAAVRRISRGRQVLRKSFHASGPGGSVNGREVRGYLRLTLEVECGPRFILNRDPFCSLKCAAAFAGAAYAAGFRRTDE